MTPLESRRFPPAIPPSVEAAVLGANRVHDAICAAPSQTIGQFELATSIVAARYVSGDFVISFEENGAWYIALGDLMGKGLAAAMWLTHVVELIRRACERDGEVSAMMGHLNREMHASRTGVPLTALFLARLEPAISRITYSCGGCPPAFLLRRDQSVKVLGCGGPILGAFGNSKYDSSSLFLEPDDLLMAVSDGFIEVHHGGDVELRVECVTQHLQAMHGKPAAEVVQSLTAKVRMSCPLFTDDLSVMAIKRLPLRSPTVPAT